MLNYEEPLSEDELDDEDSLTYFNGTKPLLPEENEEDELEEKDELEEELEEELENDEDEDDDELKLDDVDELDSLTYRIGTNEFVVLIWVLTVSLMGTRLTKEDDC